MEFNKETDKALIIGALLFATGFLSLVGGIKMQWSIAGTTGTAWVLYLIAFVLIGVGKMFAHHGMGKK